MFLMSLRRSQQAEAAAGGAAHALVDERRRRLLRRLPQHEVTAEHADESLRRIICVICLESFAAGDRATTLPCLHQFHSGCIESWIAEQPVCPICKHRVDEFEE